MAFKDSNCWLNRSDSGKGFLLRIDTDDALEMIDKAEEDADSILFTGSIEGKNSLKKFVDGDSDGLKLTKIVPDEE